MRTFPFLLILLLITQPKVLSAQYHGRVIGSSGEPLAGVTITDNIFHQVTTDFQGRFKFDDPNPRSTLSLINADRIVRFTLSGYEPSTRVLTPNSDAEVVLEKTDTAAWRPPICGATNDKEVVPLMVFSIPKKVEYDHVTKEAAAYFDGILDSLCWRQAPYGK
jgi:hypothetical protein